jgi:hypothetical protein
MKDFITTSTRLILRPGIYKCTIEGGKYDAKNEMTVIHCLVSPADHDEAIKQTLRFPMKRLWWLLNKLCIAAGFDLRKAPVLIYSKKGNPCLKGKTIWMAVRLYQEVTEDGEILNEYYEPFRFFAFTSDEAKPNLLGDPDANNGNYYDEFHKVVMYSENEPKDYYLMSKPKQLNE